MDSPQSDIPSHGLQVGQIGHGYKTTGIQKDINLELLDPGWLSWIPVTAK